jgi:hypothetical protein
MWPSRHLDFPDAWLSATTGTHAVEIHRLEDTDVEWDNTAIDAAVCFAENVVIGLEEAWNARLAIGKAPGLEEQANALLLSGLVRPDWRPGFNLLAPAVWALGRLNRNWSGRAIRSVVLRSLQGGLRFNGVSVLFSSDHQPAVTEFLLMENLAVRFLGLWDAPTVLTVLSIGQNGEEYVWEFAQDVLFNVVAEVCMFPYEVVALADTATQLFALLEGE